MRRQVVCDNDNFPSDVLLFELLLNVTEEVDPVQLVRRRTDHELERFYKIRTSAKDGHTTKSFGVDCSLNRLICHLPCFIVLWSTPCSETGLINKHDLALSDHQRN